MDKTERDSIINIVQKMLPGSKFNSEYTSKEKLLIITVFYKGFRNMTMIQRFDLLTKKFADHGRKLLQSYSVAFEAWVDADEMKQYTHKDTEGQSPDSGGIQAAASRT